MTSRFLPARFALLLSCFLNREAIPAVVERRIAEKPESQVWTGLNAVSLQSITQKSIEHRIGCNCGAFAPHFFVFFFPCSEDLKKIDMIFYWFQILGLFRPLFSN